MPELRAVAFDLDGTLYLGAEVVPGAPDVVEHVRAQGLKALFLTNTTMRNGKYDPKEIIASVKNGVFAANFGGGQVDITSGKFVFSCTEAYLIEDGKVGAPVKGATLIGNGPDALTRVKMIGNDLKLDAGIGTCGKQGQGVPVGVGQPTLLIEGLTVGGTAAAA